MVGQWSARFDVPFNLDSDTLDVAVMCSIKGVFVFDLFVNRLLARWNINFLSFVQEGRVGLGEERL